MRSLSLPLSVSRDAVQFVEGLGAGRRSVLPDAAPGRVNQRNRLSRRRLHRGKKKPGEKWLCLARFLLLVFIMRGLCLIILYYLWLIANNIILYLLYSNTILLVICANVLQTWLMCESSS